MREIVRKFKGSLKRIMGIVTMFVLGISQSVFASTLQEQFYDGLQERMVLIDVILISLVFIAMLGSAFDNLIGRKVEDRTKLMDAIPNIVTTVLFVTFILMIVRLIVGSGASGTALETINVFLS